MDGYVRLFEDRLKIPGNNPTVGLCLEYFHFFVGDLVKLLRFKLAGSIYTVISFRFPHIC